MLFSLILNAPLIGKPTTGLATGYEVGHMGDSSPEDESPRTVIARTSCSWAGGDVVLTVPLLLDDSDVPVGVVEPTTAVGCDGDDVFDTHAEPAGEVDTGFDGEAHSRLKRLQLALDHVRRLVRRHPDPGERSWDSFADTGHFV